MPRILLISLVFSPDGVSTAQLMKELAVDLQEAGNTVIVLTTTPHYNQDEVAERQQPLRRTWSRLVWQSEVGGVRVYHVWVPRKAGGILRRAWGWALFHLMTLIVAMTVIRRAQIILVPSPLLTLGVLGRWLAPLLGAKLVYNVQELYPDLAAESGAIKSALLLRLLLRIERYVYRHAAAVSAITDGIRDAIVAKGIPDSRVITIPNFVDVSDLSPGPRENPFSVHHGWSGKFVVSYAGNLGVYQGLEVLAEVAPRVAQHGVLIAFVGEGGARELLQRRAMQEQLKNVQFIGHQPYALVPEIYAASDICVVALSVGVRVGALPSKLMRIMACGRPILAICEPDSDLARVVIAAGAGVVCAPSDAAGIAAAVLHLKRSPQVAVEMGERGRAYVTQGLTRSAISREYGELFQRLIGSGWMQHDQERRR